MTTETKIPSTSVSDVARLMTDDSSCPHSVWFLSRHSSSLRTYEHGQDPVARDPRRTSLIRKTAASLEESGHDVYPSLRNAFESRGSRSGARVKGRPDLIVRDTDGTVTVYDVMEGEPREADDLQVRLYMYLLPRSNHGLWRGKTPVGCVLYTDGTVRQVEVHEVDEEFVERVAAMMRQIAADEPARHVPSAEECGGCVLTSSDCSKRVETVPGAPGNAGLGNTPASC